MCGTRVLRSLAVLLAAALVLFSYPVAGVAQQSTESLQDRMRDMQRQIDQLNEQLKQLREEQSKTQQAASTATQQMAATQKKVDSADKAWNTFIKGFFGTLDVSIDETTKGMSDMIAYHWGSAANGGPPYVNNGAKSPPGPFGRVSWMSMMSSNGSNIGYRGNHKIGTSDFDFIYQISTAIDVAAAPGLQNTWTKSSNTVQGAIGLGDTWVGLRNKDWGQLRFGEMFTPYKTSTDRLNPFTGMLGNYSVVMGNTGGDNRIEFGTRMDHVITYSSPTMSGFSFDASYSFGQNPDPYNNTTPLGSPDCSGANNPGSGNLFLNCDDGGFNYSYGGDLKFETGGLYLVAAYELHSQVNRSSDGIGSNNPFYGALPGSGPGCTGGVGPPSPLLDCLPGSQYLTFVGEFPVSSQAGSPPYSALYDVADEKAVKVGGQYRFPFGLTVSALWEEMKRDLPAALQFQNERQRIGDWLAVEYEFNEGVDKIAAGWAHAGATPGDPGGQHNYYPGGIGNNQANMYTFAYWHKFDKQLTYYLDVADTANDGNAHYDIGAGGHGIKTDCHDATHTPFIDYSSAGPTTWGGCHEIGVSTGLNFKF